jgi:hypothetical protein
MKQRKMTRKQRVKLEGLIYNYIQTSLYEVCHGCSPYQLDASREKLIDYIDEMGQDVRFWPRQFRTREDWTFSEKIVHRFKVLIGVYEG